MRRAATWQIDYFDALSPFCGTSGLSTWLQVAGTVFMSTDLFI